MLPFRLYTLIVVAPIVLVGAGIDEVRRGHLVGILLLLAAVAEVVVIWLYLRLPVRRSTRDR